MATPNPPVAGTPEEAMNRVLGAEHDAKAAITECEALAAATVTGMLSNLAMAAAREASL